MTRNSCNYQKAMDENASSFEGNLDEYLQWNVGVFPIEKNKKILDLGCGPGSYFKEIMKYEPSLYYATDYDEHFLNKTLSLFNGRSNCKAAELDIMDQNAFACLKGNEFDYVLCLDVLEHIEDHAAVLSSIHKIISNTGNGILFLRVPAIQSIYGENDRAIGHQRRYSAKYLRKILEECFFDVEIMRYQNILGIIPWYLIGNVMKRKLAVSSIESKCFNLIVPFMRKVENILPPPIGLSIYCVCTIKTRKVHPSLKYA